MSPATTPLFGDALFVSESDAAWSVDTVVPPVPDTGPSCGSRPAMVAVFTIEPASTSAWVTV